mmetsp:Transcript_2746/g.6138  ORF Transcript_2746/g.6138 Transcript_2746/m.6138 type:complete len:88 (-) Transcript_2746:29-292(-)
MQGMPTTPQMFENEQHNAHTQTQSQKQTHTQNTIGREEGEEFRKKEHSTTHKKRPELTSRLVQIATRVVFGDCSIGGNNIHYTLLNQ